MPAKTAITAAKNSDVFKNMKTPAMLSQK